MAAHVRFKSLRMTKSAIISLAQWLTYFPGLRVLSGPAAIALLDKVEQLLTYSPFLTLEDHVRVLSGEEEGVFAWVAANYLKGFFWVDK